MLQFADIKFNKYQLSKDSSRIFFFFKNEDIPRAVKVLKNTIGIQSLSPALRTSNQIKNITERTIQVCKNYLEEGDTFAVTVKRSGKHDYNSRDVAVKVGKAILDDLHILNLKVNLTAPKKVVYIEVRNEFSYLFAKKFKKR